MKNSNLEKRVKRFSVIGMRMGDAYLVDDLWSEIMKLQIELTKKEDKIEQLQERMNEMKLELSIGCGLSPMIFERAERLERENKQLQEQVESTIKVEKKEKPKEVEPLATISIKSEEIGKDIEITLTANSINGASYLYGIMRNVQHDLEDTGVKNLIIKCSGKLWKDFGFLSKDI